MISITSFASPLIANQRLAKMNADLFAPKFHSFSFSKPLGIANIMDILKALSDAGLETENLKPILAFLDIGSTGIRLSVIQANLQNGGYTNLYLTKRNLSFGIDHSNKDIVLNAIIELINLANFFRPVEHIAVATASFREAGTLGEELVQEIYQKTSVYINIANQQFEGILVYLGVRMKSKEFDPALDLVWDIGGGSLQIIGKDSYYQYNYWGSNVAGRTFNNYLLESIRNSFIETLNPMSYSEIDSALWQANEMLSYSPGSPYIGFAPEDWYHLKSRIERNKYTIYAVGAAHNFGVLQLVNHFLKQDRDYYTLADISTLLELFVDKDDEYLLSTNQFPHLDHARTAIPILVLVQCFLTKLEIQKVKVIDINNTDGLFAEYFFIRQLNLKDQCLN